MAFTTTLIIGLGGIGSRIVEGIYKKFDASNPSDIDRRNVGFLCLDTDINDINLRKKVMPEGSVVRTSSDLSDTIGGYIEKIKDKTTVLDWFDTKSSYLLSMSLNEGAAQVRMASRLASMSAINEQKFAAIDNSIRLLLETDPERHPGNNIKVHIVCSLAGGTGAGSFLQTAYYVKNALRENGSDAPKISGYFLLADVLCNDSNTGLSEGQKNNVRSNTYACMKELSAFCSSDRDKSVKSIQYEYRMGQRDKRLPADPPYDFCFVMDYFGADGGNLNKEERYEEQTVEFIYTNAFDPLGDNYRQKAINDLRQLVEHDGADRFASFGISKLIYPVDDLMAYFASQRVVDNLSGTWLRIDKAFDELYAEYKKNTALGIRMNEPDRGTHFMQQVEAIGMTDTGREGMEFRQILESTKTYEEGKDIGIPKSRLYIEGVGRYVEKLLATNQEIQGLYKTCTVPNPNFTKNTGADNDLGFVARRERELEEYRKAVMNFIESTKSVAIKQCLIADYDLEHFVSNNPEANANRLNTYILEKEKELHPLAVRYLLYDIKSQLKKSFKKKKAENKKLEIQINETYKKLFDNPETKDHVEDAREKLRKANDKHAKFFQKAVDFFSGQNPYKAAKEDYETKSRQQAESIRKYCREKLLEETYAGLLMQINALIHAEEQFFKSLPNAIRQVNGECESLLKKHDANNNPSVSYVLAKAEIKQNIYDSVISMNDSPFFPNEMSAALYRSLFDNVVKSLEADGQPMSRKQSAREKEALQAEANKKIIGDCVAFQETLIREKNRQFSEMNVIDALRTEAMWECGNDEAKAEEYMIKKFHYFRDRAEIWGPFHLDNEVRYINAWGLNPICLDPRTISEKLADKLFGATDVGTNVKTAATRITSTCYSPDEISRVNAVTLLAVDRNYKGFIAKEKTSFTDEQIGTYYEAYQEVIDKVNLPNSKTYSPHQDKHWHLPAYMPNIGSTQLDEIERVFKALCWGLLFGRFRSEAKGGDNYWKFVGSQSCFIKDIDGKMILVGNSLKYAVSRLFEGLMTNPDIVRQVLEDADMQWEKAKEQWLQKEIDETDVLEKMKNLKMVRDIAQFQFFIKEKTAQSKNNNWFSLLTSKDNLLLDRLLDLNGGRLRSRFFDELMNRLIFVFGPSIYTRKVCEYLILKNVEKSNLDIAIARIQVFEGQNRFQPKDS